ncbi:MAG: 2-oxoacid:acceptor oxidoreductase subunit alpha [Roseovarius sp.]
MAIEFLDGNEAAARGALAAGCDFFAGYPITPSSTILGAMLQALPAAGGIGIQAEDEIAAIGLCIGAAMAGRKALTTTSGPGISLYSENIGLAMIAETPLVIVNVQRQGPATGSATKGADGDIQFTRWVTSGGLPVIALCPSTVAECYEMTYRAFNLAERFRVPVFVLSNKEIGMTRETVDLEAIALPPRIERRPHDPALPLRPHGFAAPAEVPAFAPLGGDTITRVTTSTHDQDGQLTTRPAVIGQMIDHYVAKIEAAADEIALVEPDLQPGAETLVVSYGVTARAAQVALARARAAGLRVSGLRLRSLFPVPRAALDAAMAGARRIIVPEMNTGQYIHEIERLAPRGAEIRGVNRMDTTLLSPDDILKGGGLLQ